MELPVNSFKHALAAGRPQIGLWSSLASNVTVELIAAAGYDWILLDMEHSPNDLESLLGQLQAAEPYPTHAVVRVPWNDTVLLKRVLDIGAQSVLVPMVNTAEEARAAVAAMRYPPRGIRGVAGQTRASRFGRVPGYGRRAEEQLCLIVQVETAAAIERIEAIAAVDGVDAMFIGPSDLAASMGHPGEAGHPAVIEAVTAAIRRIVAAGKPAGVLTQDAAFTRLCIEAGSTFTAVGTDLGVLLRGAEALALGFRPG
jgi:4-hydroxy-2-oxoheptanedioate aldolase